MFVVFCALLIVFSIYLEADFAGVAVVAQLVRFSGQFLPIDCLFFFCVIKSLRVSLLYVS